MKWSKEKQPITIKLSTNNDVNLCTQLHTSHSAAHIHHYEDLIGLHEMYADYICCPVVSKSTYICTKTAVDLT